MSQLVVRPGRNAARQAKKLKEIRKVKHAIQWHERERKKRQELKQERWESKQAVLQRIMWENEHVKGVKKRALANAKEDWKLGPLRPNRATGPDADKYGALMSNQMQKPEIPVKTQKNRNAVREKKGLELEYPLVVDDQKYFPIVKDDRVVILKGKDAGKIGVVQDIIARTHEIIVKDLNMVCTILYAHPLGSLTISSNTMTPVSSMPPTKTWAPSTLTRCHFLWTTFASSYLLRSTKEV
jgi:large subunit ribosomal protein L24